ncbi:redox-sensitive bicupin YhaK (pirin superfamily) [Paenibacillus shirakamiensis]|uniref:Redox-sensitive bicupin YhaK (Pirin superfamily) n=1 Tax=Paenibacillus shirakamiensis TaxID=1265935 RepID=A0ABS4JL69_9BACL|nr:pirin family protein [Paenibacillus shirakamiensis]MBP2002470.1 redox-sensitive bicupin YhaK (pirin superfamily) [Paenibacillus shirakamiensis]
MIKVITSDERHTSDRGWIHSEFSFSFSDYEDPSNAHFGCLLAHNENILKPKQGFKKHPHHDLEIVSYVVSGTLNHTDDLGNTQELKAGTVQVMSAGTGVVHEENNPSSEEEVRFIQMWFLPDKPSELPYWQSRSFEKQDHLNALLPIVSGRGEESTLPINQELTVYLSTLETGNEVSLPHRENRRSHVFIISGHIEITCGDEKLTLNPGDATRIKKSCDLLIRGIGSECPAEFILIDMP